MQSNGYQNKYSIISLLRVHLTFLAGSLDYERNLHVYQYKRSFLLTNYVPLESCAVLVCKEIRVRGVTMYLSEIVGELMYSGQFASVVNEHEMDESA
jgi:hypothetical protein